MTLDKKKTERNLLKKGFSYADHRSDDHIYLEYFHNGILILYTKISHGKPKDIDDFLIGLMAKQCKIKSKEFIHLVSCNISKEEYLKILIDNGLV